MVRKLSGERVQWGWKEIDRWAGDIYLTVGLWHAR